MKKTNVIMFLIVLASFAIAFYYYPKMPSIMISHWGEQGQPNGYMTKFWALFLMPIISFFMVLLFLFIPKIDPMKENIAKFRKYFDNFIIIILLFLFYAYLLTVFWNLGKNFNMIFAIIPAFSLIFYYAGVLMEKSKRNWFIGIRTPWTLSSDEIWDKTHRLGGKLFKATAILSFCGLFFKEYAIWFMMVPVVASTTYVFVYSYLEFKKINKKI